MMKNWKRWFTCGLAAMLTIGGVACGGRGELNEEENRGGYEGVEEDYAEGITVSKNEKEIYKDTKEGKTRLKIAFVDAGFGSDWLRVIATHFVAENPEYWVYLDGDPGLTELVATQLEAGMSLPDLYMPLGHDWQTYVFNGWLEEMSDVYNAKPDGEEGKTVYEKMIPSWQQYCIASDGTSEGKYSYPWSGGVTGIVYNGKMFEQYGWEVPTTMTELLALCEEIKTDTQDKVAPFVYPGSIGGYFDFMGMTHWLQSTGAAGLNEFYSYPSAEIYNPDKQPAKGKMEALEAFTSIFGPEVDYTLKGSMSKNHMLAQRDFLNGNAAMIINGGWMETEMISELPEGFEMRMMRIPYIETAQKDEQGNYIPVNWATQPDIMIIPKQAPQKEAAKKFLVYMATDAMLNYFTKYTATMRPFEYEVEGLETMSKFTQDCANIWKNSENFIPVETGPLANNPKVSTWIIGQPYNLLVYGMENDGTTPSRWCKMEYLEAKGKWKDWVAGSTD